MPLREAPRPNILIIYNARDLPLADRFVAELSYYEECGLVRLVRWFVADAFMEQAENQRLFFNRLETASVVLTLATRNLINSRYYQQVLKPALREYRNSDVRSVFSIITSPLNEDERVSLLDERFLYPSDGRSVFGEHRPEEMEGVFAEIAENIFLQLIQKIFRPGGVAVGMKSKVFISYARANYQAAQAVRGFLAGQNYVTWMDKYNIKGGQNWVNAIDTGLRESWAVVLLLSHAAKASEYVNYEWSFAFGANTCVIPVMIENIHLHPRLSWINCLNWYHLPHQQYPWSDLIDALDDSKIKAAGGMCNT